VENQDKKIIRESQCYV